MSMLLHKVCSTVFQHSLTNEMTERESLICRLIGLHSFFLLFHFLLFSESFCFSLHNFKVFERCKTRIVKTYVFLNKFLATTVMNLTKTRWSMVTNNKKSAKKFMILVIYDIGYNQPFEHFEIYGPDTN